MSATELTPTRITTLIDEHRLEIDDSGTVYDPNTCTTYGSIEIWLDNLDGDDSDDAEPIRGGLIKRPKHAYDED